MIDPDIYVLDEPSSNLTHTLSLISGQLLFTLKSQGKTIIISEHRLYYLSGLFDRVFYLRWKSKVMIQQRGIFARLRW